jgi:hypothetical protein
MENVTGANEIIDEGELARRVRPITLEQAMANADKLRELYTRYTSGEGGALPSRCFAGLKFIDFFTFKQRLSVRGKMNMNFFDFYAQWDRFKGKKYVNNLLRFYGGNESPTTVYKIYNLAVNSIHAFRPAAALQIYDRFKPTRILDPCAGWGGRALAAHIYGAAYTGYDCNLELTDAYAAMTASFGSGGSSRRSPRPKVTLQIADSLRIDYSRIGSYDCVMTSPPYYNLERYPNNCAFTTDDDMDDRFYFPLFYSVMDCLQPGGWIVLSINEKLLHRVFDVLYGPPHVTFPLTAYKRKAYSENIYAWQK